MFEVTHIGYAERVELVTYQLKGVTRILFDQWKKSRVEGAPIVSCDVSEGAFMGHFFPRELIEAKVIEMFYS